MSHAYEYDPDEQFVDDATGDAQVNQIAVEGMNQEAPNQGNTSANSPSDSSSSVNSSGDNFKPYNPALEDEESSYDDYSSDVQSSRSADVAEFAGAAHNNPHEDALMGLPVQEAVSAYIPDYTQDEEVHPTEDQFTTAYDIIDHIDEIVESAPSVLFSRTQARVDREELRDLLSELKDVLPVQLERASTLMREAERRLSNAQTQATAIISNANSKAATIIKEANDQARFLAGQENVVSLATEQARTILNTAQEKAHQLTTGANEYTVNSMQALDKQLVELRHSIASGLQVLQERQRQAEQEVPRLTPEDYPQD